MSRARYIIQALFIFAAALPADALAQAKSAPARPTAKASFRIVLIDASKAAKPFVDPKLASMKGQLRPFSGKYNRFVALSKHLLSLQAGETGKVKLPARGDFGITFLDLGNGKVRRVRYQVEMPRPHTKMTRRVAPGGQTLDVIPSQGKLTIVATTVLR